MDFSWFHLVRNPFTALPELAVSFLSQSQEDALQAVMSSIEGQRGFMAVLGEAGVGKTTVLRSYLSRPNQKNRLQVIYISCFQLSFFEIVKRICQECQIDFDAHDMRKTVERMNDVLSDRYKNGKKVVVILDNIHSASFSTLTNLPLLSDIQLNEKKLLQIVLVGRLEFQHIIKRPELRELQRCLCHRSVMSLFTLSESKQYVQHRLAHVARREEPIFSPRALKRLIKYAQGNPRILDQLCSEALVAGALQYQVPISVRLAREVIDDFARRSATPRGRWKPVGVTGAILVAVLSCGMYVAYWGTEWLPMLPGFSTVRRTPAPASPMVSLSQDLGHIPREENNAAVLEMVPPAFAMVQPARLSEVQTQPDAAPLLPRVSSETSVPVAAGQAERAVEGSEHRAVPETRQTVATTDLTATSVVCVMPRPTGERGKDIVSIDYAGHTITRLVANGALNLAPVLSPDGMRLAYTTYRDGTPAIYLYDLKNTSEERLGLRSGLALPGSWSSDGRYLVLSQSVDGNSDIFLYDIHNKRVQRLTTHQDIDILPSFAPDSTRLIFTSKRDGSLQIYLTDVQGRPPVRLTTVGLYNTSAVWSPRDDTIAFIGRASAEQPLAIYTIRADGTGLQRLTQGEIADDPPVWAPNGRFLMYTRLRDGVQERRLVGVDGQENRAMVSPGLTCHSPQWVAQQLS
jgi:type II secretory pathway predicted ATPase ExeA